MLSLLVHRLSGRTLGYLFAASIAGAPLPSRPVAGRAHPSAPATVVQVSDSFADGAEQAPLPPGSSIAVEGHTVVGPVDVAPRGWRKTTRGWERAETWANVVAATNGQRLQHILDRQLAAEQASLPTRWLNSLFAAIRRIDPITLVSLQIASVSLFMAMVYHREARERVGTCGSSHADVCG